MMGRGPGPSSHSRERSGSSHLMYAAISSGVIASSTVNELPGVGRRKLQGVAEDRVAREPRERSCGFRHGCSLLS